ncbi:MAG: TetR/AcrR family transcriptional regulator C-terminal domain-containing protein [Geodermatophilaceae bacterium]
MAQGDHEATDEDAAARTTLDVERVRGAALEVLDAEGAESLSMRGVAKVLNRKAMTLYRYARNRAALLDGVVELVLNDLSIDPAAADWRQELRELAGDFQRLALAHPNVVPLLVTLPRATPLGLRPAGTLVLLEDFLELLTRAGYTSNDALHAYRLFFGFLHGHVLGQLQEGVEDHEEAVDQLRLALHRLPKPEFPQLRALGTELADYDGASQLRRGVEMMIIGLQSLIRPSEGAAPTS